MKTHKSTFDTVLEIFVLFYSFKSLKVTFIIRKVNINCCKVHEIIDLLVIKGLVLTDDNGEFFLTAKGESLVYEVVPLYKNLKKIFSCYLLEV